jgi:hypothetical protein
MLLERQTIISTKPSRSSGKRNLGDLRQFDPDWLKILNGQSSNDWRRSAFASDQESLVRMMRYCAKSDRRQRCTFEATVSSVLNQFPSVTETVVRISPGSLTFDPIGEPLAALGKSRNEIDDSRRTESTTDKEGQTKSMTADKR